MTSVSGGGQQHEGYNLESAGYTRPPPPTNQESLSPEDVAFQQAQKIVAKYNGQSFDSLNATQQEELVKNTAIMVRYTNSQAIYDSVINAATPNPYTTNDAVLTALRGKTFDSSLLASLRLGRPELVRSTSIDANTNVPSDVAGNTWFSGNSLLNLRLAALDLAKVNRDMALELNLMDAFLTSVFIDTKTEEANLVKKSYDKQAEQAMWEMIGACVSLGVTTAGMATTLGGASVGAARGARGTPQTTKTIGPDGVTPIKFNPAQPGGRMGALRGAGEGAAATEGIIRQSGAAGQSTGQIISDVGKMMTLKDLGEIERSKIHVQAAADMIKKAMDSCSEEAKAALQHNDELRAFLKASDDERVRIFGSITAHG